MALFVFCSTASSCILNISDFVLFGSRIIHSVGVNKAQFLCDSEPIRLLETPRSVSEYILMNFI